MNKNIFLLIFVICAVVFFLVIMKESKAGKSYIPEPSIFPAPNPKTVNNQAPKNKKPSDATTISIIEDYQIFFKDYNFTGIGGSIIKMDGVWGKNTQNAYDLFLAAYSKKAMGAPDYNFTDVIRYRVTTPFSKVQSTNPFRQKF